MELKKADISFEDETKNNEKNIARELLLKAVDENPGITEEIILATRLDPDVKISSLIFTSNKYDEFKTLTGNRDLNKGNLNKLTKSIEKYGYRSSQPITLDLYNFIMNGQHRKFICESKGLPIYFNYDRLNEDSLSVTMEMNISQKNWALLDFVKSHANLGNEDYKNFLELMTTEQVSPSLIIWIIYHSRNGITQDKIKNGELRCNERDKTIVRRTVAAIKELRDQVPGNLPKERKLRGSFLGDKIAVPLAIIMDQPNYNQSRMLKQIARCYNSIDTRSMSVAGETLVNIYNLRLKDSNSRLVSYQEMERYQDIE